MGELIGLLFYMVLSLPLVRTLALTLVPALALLAYVRKKDWLEPEPPKLVWGLFGLGVLSVIPAFFSGAGRAVRAELMAGQRIPGFQADPVVFGGGPGGGGLQVRDAV